MPRSGSTFLHELLTEDPENRVPRVWEVIFPIPRSKPPKKSIRVCARPRLLCGGFAGSLRERIRFTRCARGRRMSAWRSIVIRSCLKNSSRSVISRLTRRFCTRRILVLHTSGRSGFSNIYSWTVRKGVGFLSLRTTSTPWIKLLIVFPDAVVIQTHRNPVEVVRSQFQLTKVLEGLFGRPGEHYQLGMREVRKIGRFWTTLSGFAMHIPTWPDSLWT